MINIIEHMYTFTTDLHTKQYKILLFWNPNILHVFFVPNFR